MKTTKQTTLPKHSPENATRIAESMKATLKKNPQASVCACIRALSKAMPKAKRSDFIAGLTQWAPPGTVTQQLYAGRRM